MGDYDSFKHGGTSYPLTASTANSLLKDADPSLYHALLFLRQCIITHVGSRMVAESTAVSAPITTAVKYYTHIDPGQNPIDTRFQYPMLAIFRKAERYTDRTTQHIRSDATWGIYYILPPLTTVQAEKLVPGLRAVANIVRNRIEVGHDSTYNSGEKVWTTAGLESIELVDSQYGTISVPDGMSFFIAWQGTIRVCERDVPLPSAWDDFAGANIAQDIDTEELGKISNVVQVYTYQEPTITALSVATGTSAGGTAVTITGTLFATGAVVTFGTLRATSVVVVSATSITCVTPAHDAAAVDVTVTNLDGQSGTSADAFTFT